MAPERKTNTQVFVTGASGWVGRGLVPDLLAQDHSVTALARSDASSAALTAAGAHPLRGTLDDLDLLRDAASSADAVVHLAFKHDIAFEGRYGQAAEDDRAAIDALADGLAGTGKALVVASGILGVVGAAPGEVATEHDGRAEHETTGPISGGGDRSDTGRHVLSLAERGIRSSLVRLPPATHGPGDNGFTTAAVASARRAGASAYVDDGGNRWPAVHRDDAARLFRLAAESAPAGSVLHAVGEEGVPIREVAEAIATGLGVPAISVDRADISDYLGVLGTFWSTDGPASAEITRDLVGWIPQHPTWLDDLRAGSYFGE